MRVGDYRFRPRRLIVPGPTRARGNSGADPVPVGDDVIEVAFARNPRRPGEHLFSSDGIPEQPRGIAWKKSETRSMEQANCHVPEAIRESRRYGRRLFPMLCGTRASCAVSEGLAHQQVRQTANTSSNDRRHYAKIHATAVDDPRTGRRVGSVRKSGLREERGLGVGVND